MSAADAGPETGLVDARDAGGEQADDAPESAAAEGSGGAELEGAEAPGAVLSKQAEDLSGTPESGDGVASDGSGDEAPAPWEASEEALELRHPESDVPAPDEPDEGHGRNAAHHDGEHASSNGEAAWHHRPGDDGHPHGADESSGAYHGHAEHAGGHDHDAAAQDASAPTAIDPAGDVGREPTDQASARHKGVWEVKSGVEGPAAGKELRRPNPRHMVSGSPGKEVKPQNSVILRGHSAAIDNDIAAIAEGRAELVQDGNRYKINDRTYGIEENGTVYPDSGPGIVKLDRNEYAALQLIVKAKGDIGAQPQLTRNPRFVNNPEAVQKALDIYNGTYK
ncbi:hypothetical protein IPZ58_29780 [Streptomyces roseoverticillatus]|uniref:hypothetical protein n=1 Tax=Streptomyces roseoverticillatus TaxID=66429 RepID=UPI001F41C804|nr:hypothetical protein [Streptomyces roseoverticillatus]MCF3105747.1 hypothetical protein [Streptomyces roseoverticillatus]